MPYYGPNYYKFEVLVIFIVSSVLYFTCTKQYSNFVAGLLFKQLSSQVPIISMLSSEEMNSKYQKGHFIRTLRLSYENSLLKWYHQAKN